MEARFRSARDNNERQNRLNRSCGRLDLNLDLYVAIAGTLHK